MKYFTKDWWAGGDRNDGQILDYQKYIDSIKAKLPDDAISLHEQYTLHDASLGIVASNMVAREVSFSLSGWDRNFKERLNYELIFEQVSNFEMFGESLDDEGPAGFGDLGYYEFELISEGAFEFRAIFSSGIQIKINFSAFKMKVLTG